MRKPVLIASTSGIRGIIGNGLNTEITLHYATAFGQMLKGGTVIVGRDSRPSGEMLEHIVTAGLVASGCKVVSIGIVPTPTVEIAVKKLKADGLICVTASHNPGQWNALKFFNSTGEFITATQYKKLDKLYQIQKKNSHTNIHSALGSISSQDGWVDKHIAMTLSQSLLAKTAIKKRKFKVVVDAINGAGSEALPTLLEKLGATVIRINCKGDGNFVHEPEPSPKNLTQLCKAVKRHKADLGMACDPDADRLALVDESGQPIGEELTLTIAVKEVLTKKKGTVVINLSTSSATADVARALGAKVFYSKVGEANVVSMMHKKKCAIGGEGNGGVIFPSFHAGRDSLIAAALTLSCLARNRVSLSQLVGTLPIYYTIKTKAALPSDFNKRLIRFGKEASAFLGTVKVDKRDGLRFDFANGWVQIRSSNTEPIYRLIVETNSKQLTSRLVRKTRMFFA